jgi:LmbE family N-acetylglucosaminyl deacetylase
VREAELRTAASIIGVRDIYFLDFIDGALSSTKPSELFGKVLSIMQRLDPEVIITFGADGITGHPDHVTVGKAATKAFKSIYHKNKTQRKLFYVTLARGVFKDEGLATRPDDKIITFNIANYFNIKIRAIAAHKSQQDARDFLAELKDKQNAFYTTKEYLYLAVPRGKNITARLFTIE